MCIHEGIFSWVLSILGGLTKIADIVSPMKSKPSMQKNKKRASVVLNQHAYGRYMSLLACFSGYSTKV